MHGRHEVARQRVRADQRGDGTRGEDVTGDPAFDQPNTSVPSRGVYYEVQTWRGKWRTSSSQQHLIENARRLSIEEIGRCPEVPVRILRMTRSYDIMWRHPS